MKRNALHSIRGFTLIEMIVVVAIIAVLVTIVVGVSGLVLSRASVERTKVNMQVIYQAIEAYHDAEENYPPDEPDSAPPADWGAGTRNWHAYCRGKKLYDELISVPQAQAHIANLKDVIMNISGNNVFVDGFDKYMEYFSSEGVGGTPVIISAGSDGDFETEKDNIRSDNR